MLRSLHIENIAVVKSLDVEFNSGFTVLTGETGAGKSIIIDSLGLLSGAKADKELIRHGESSAFVSALFGDVPAEAAIRLSEMGIECEDGTVLLSRSISATSSGARINGRSVTASMLREAAGVLFGIHGQNDNLQMMDAKNHIKFLDGFARLQAKTSGYAQLYREILNKRCEIDAIERDERERERICEVLRFQISDIDALKLKEGEEEALEELVRRLSAAEKINRAASLGERALQGSEKNHGAIYLISRAASAMSGIEDAVAEAHGLSERLESIRYELEDIAQSIADITDIGDGDPTAKLDRAQARLNAISKLKRKYGADISEILKFRNDAYARLDELEHACERREELCDELSRLEEEATGVCELLHNARVAAAEELSARVCSTLEFLDMPRVRFEVSVRESTDYLPSGKDIVEFLISTNVGEPMMPMIKIASGGELARIMLSLKNVLNECDGISTVVFDEIDTGISGKTSRKVGIKLKEIADGTQVLCVTHSAQIASLAHNHLKIIKTEADGRANTRLCELDREGRVEEISRILGGIEITDAVRRAARELIDNAEVF